MIKDKLLPKKKKKLKTEEKHKFKLDVLENLITKYRSKDVEEVVYRLSYAGKYIIIKGKTLAGSLLILAEGLYHYKNDPENPRYINHLYRLFFDYILMNEGRFRIKRIAKRTEVRVTQFHILKAEQIELDKCWGDGNILNLYNEAYIPQFNPNTQMYGWLNKEDVTRFQGWMISKRRIQRRDRYQQRTIRLTSKP